MTEASDTIAKLKIGDEQTLKDIYLANKKPFFLFAARYQLASDDVLDTYQDAIIALCENAKKGKIDVLKSSIQTYLFAIGKFMIFKKLKNQKEFIAIDDNLGDNFEWIEIEENNQIILLSNAIKKLGEQCQNVLRLFYYEEKKLDEIQSILNYSNKDVLKAQKSRCLKQLKDLIHSK